MYLEGYKNVVADALSRLNADLHMVAHSLCTLEADFHTHVSDDDEVTQAELFSSASGSTTEDTGYPLSAHRIAQEQANDKQLVLLLKTILNTSPKL